MNYTGEELSKKSNHDINEFADVPFKFKDQKNKKKTKMKTDFIQIVDKNSSKKKKSIIKPIKKFKGFTTKSGLLSGLIRLYESKNDTARDYTLCCPCMNAKNEDSDECIVINLVVRFKSEDHHDELQDCFVYGDILKNLNDALTNGKGDYDREPYKDVETEWYVGDAGIEVESIMDASKSKIEPDVDLTK